MRDQPTYCTSCGGRLQSESRIVEFVCAHCGTRTFQNPAPNARVAVVERRAAAEDRLLLVEIADSGRVGDPPYHDSEWMLPGGHPEYREQPREAAARELEEETGLTVDPSALVPIDTVSRWVVAEKRGLVALYAVERARTAGELTGEDDATDAQFWTPSDLTAAAERRFRELYEEPDQYTTPTGMLAAATTAIDARRAVQDGGS
jgi:ADP-ribose pyrophosphatase YjhB (NUDIX family)